jgi:hypothetical protein
MGVVYLEEGATKLRCLDITFLEYLLYVERCEDELMQNDARYITSVNIVFLKTELLIKHVVGGCVAQSWRLN